jgi:hypothetical protein
MKHLINNNFTFSFVQLSFTEERDDLSMAG